MPSLQTLQWNCPGGLSGSDVLIVQVYDHETVGKNRYRYTYVLN